MRIIIVRHCQTIENRKEICQTQDGGRLSSEGRHQAKCLAWALKKEKISLIISSDSTRTMDTVKEINQFHGAPVIEDALIREKNMGIFIGKPRALVRKAREIYGISKCDFRPEGGENYPDLRRRANIFAKKLLKRKEKQILIVTHAGMIRMLLCVLLRMTIKESLKICQKNACINILESKKGIFRALKINSTEHLVK